MARMFPDPISESTRSSAERKLYTAMRDGLGDDYVVFHSVAWLARRAGSIKVDGEADFVIAHPEYGLLVLEVKGGRIKYDGTRGRWSTVDRNGVEHGLLRDPIAQAKDARYELYRKLKDVPQLSSFHYAVCHAVCFPDATAELDIRLDFPRDILLDQQRVAAVGDEIPRVFSYWGVERSEQGPGKRGISALIDVLAPKRELKAIMGSAIEEENRLLAELTQEQFIALDLLSRQRRALISGCAGSGKTVLALEKARRLADEGFSVLLTCFNANLASWLRSHPLARPGIKISSFHQLCIDLAVQASVSIPALESEVVQDDRDYYFKDLLPISLLEAVEKLGAQHDALVVDEGQDFIDTWWVGLEALLSDVDRGIIYIFYDDNQNIYAGVEQSFPFEEPVVTLTKNCRNTKSINKIVQKFYSGQQLIESLGPTGRAPTILLARPGSSPLRQLKAQLHELVVEQHIDTSDIVILTSKSKIRSALGPDLKLGNFRLVWGSPARVDEIQVSTIHAFKGLERSVVVLAELPSGGSPDREKLLYIATSRARNHLVVLGSLDDPE